MEAARRFERRSSYEVACDTAVHVAGDIHGWNARFLLALRVNALCLIPAESNPHHGSRNNPLIMAPRPVSDQEPTWPSDMYMAPIGGGNG